MSAAPATPPAPIASGAPPAPPEPPPAAPTSLAAPQPAPFAPTSAATTTANGLTPPKSKPPPAVSRSSQPRRREAQSRMKVSDAKPGVLLQEHLLRHFYNTVVPGSVSTSPPAFIWITPPFRSPKFNLFFVRNAVHFSLVAPPVRVAFWSVVCQSACSVFGCRPKTSQTSCLFRVVCVWGRRFCCFTRPWRPRSAALRPSLRQTKPQLLRNHLGTPPHLVTPPPARTGFKTTRPLLLPLAALSLNALRLGLAMPLLECLEVPCNQEQLPVLSPPARLIRHANSWKP